MPFFSHSFCLTRLETVCLRKQTAVDSATGEWPDFKKRLLFAADLVRIALSPCPDHHQVVEKTGARFLFLHPDVNAACVSRHPGFMLPLWSVASSHHNWDSSGVGVRSGALIIIVKVQRMGQTCKTEIRKKRWKNFTIPGHIVIPVKQGQSQEL